MRDCDDATREVRRAMVLRLLERAVRDVGACASRCDARHVARQTSVNETFKRPIMTRDHEGLTRGSQCQNGAHSVAAPTRAPMRRALRLFETRRPRWRKVNPRGRCFAHASTRFSRRVSAQRRWRRGKARRCARADRARGGFGVFTRVRKVRGAGERATARWRRERARGRGGVMYDARACVARWRVRRWRVGASGHSWDGDARP